MQGRSVGVKVNCCRSPGADSAKAVSVLSLHSSVERRVGPRRQRPVLAQADGRLAGFDRLQSVCSDGRGMYGSYMSGAPSLNRRRWGRSGG